MKNFTIDILCDFCGSKVGEHTLETRFGWTKENAIPAKLGFLDVRCDSCSVTHGSFRELMDKARMYIPDVSKREAFVKKHRTLANVTDALDRVKADGSEKANDIIK